MQYGKFTPDGREYVVTNPFTPRPWHNFLFNDIYLSNLTQVGTGSSFYQPRGEGLRANMTEDKDGGGGPRFVYLRDNDTGEYWTVTGAPGYPQMTEWECRVGLGYQLNRSLHHGIEAAWRVFVPDAPPSPDPVEYWTITLTNRSPKTRKISAFPYVEMQLTGGSTLMDFIAVIGGRYEPGQNGAGAVFGINSCVKFPPRFKAFLASDAKVAAATVSRDEFVGHYRDYHNPVAVERGDVHNPEAGTEWLGASLKHDYELKPGETVTFNCLLGMVESVDEGQGLIAQYLAPGECARHFAAMEAASAAMVERTVVETPDEQFNRWMNVWLKHQLKFVGRWGRVIGRGYRDILQDIFAHRITEPAKARECILEVFSKQFPNGKCIRAWRLPIAILDLQDYADSPSWMIMALQYYLKETGDFAILQEQVPFLNQADPYAAPVASATVWEHVVLAQRYLLQHLGSHNLSKIYYGDWCDTMNGVGRAGRGESVMLSMQVKWGCDLLAELADRVGDKTLASEMTTAAAKLADAINTTAWDGKWYLRAFDDHGVPVGSSNPPPEDNGEGKIFLNPQSWSIISGVASKERAESAVASAREFLDCGYGMVLNYPAFTSLKPRIGQMTAMTPGFYENASVYVHGNCFWIYALARWGQGQLAWDAIRAVLPDTPNKPNADTEPFVIPNYYIGPNVQRRMQRNLYLSGWRTGSASFMYMTGIEWILGVRAEYDGLVIDPKLPEGWKTARIRREFRGATYDVRFENPSGKAGAAVREIVVDGRKSAGNVLPAFGDGKVHEVKVVLA